MGNLVKNIFKTLLLLTIFLSLSACRLRVANTDSISKQIAPVIKKPVTPAAVTTSTLIVTPTPAPKPIKLPNIPISTISTTSTKNITTPVAAPNPVKPSAAVPPTTPPTGRKKRAASDSDHRLHQMASRTLRFTFFRF
jgi:hypothetical protein